MSDEQSAAAAAFARQRAAMAVEGTTAPEKAVLLVLAIMANAAGEAWPPIRGGNGLAARTSLGERTVARALRGLEAAGHVTTREVRGKGSIYTVHPCQSGSPARAAGVSERQGTPAGAAAHPCRSGSQTTIEQPGTAKRKKATPPPSKRAGDAAAQGTRLAPDFEPPPDWIEWAATERGWSHADATAEAVEFRDYWIAQPGARARKADWPATWRNWVRRSRREPSTMRSVNGQRTDRPGGGRGPGFARDRLVDGFTAVLRDVAARGGSDHDRGG